MKKITLLFILLLAFQLAGFSQSVFYVSGDVAASGSGTSWAQAFKTIQEGIDAAYSSLTDPAAETAQVWVKQGTYYVYTSSTENTIAMKEGVEIYGGFNGTETLLSERNFLNNTTTLDGHEFNGSANQVKHVVAAYGQETSPDVWNDWTNGRLDGFTITGGKIQGGGKGSTRATDPSSILSTADATSGAGVLIFKSAPTISNCIIKANEAPKGGGMYIMSATSEVQSDVPVAQISNCTFSNNTAYMRGGGISIDLYSEPVIENTKFLNNTCNAKGGGVYIDWVCPQPVFINCLFAGNDAVRAGAAGIDGSSSPVFINCTITGNTSTDVGAGLYTGSYNPDGSDANEPILINCLVTENTTTWGGATDLRIWHDDYFYVSHSALGEGFTSFGDGVTYDTPTFTDAPNGDYSLAGGSVGIDGGVSSDALVPAGISIPTTDIDGNVRDAAPDMGCYEYINPAYAIATAVVGGTATVSTNPATEAIASQTVTVNISNIESGKQFSAISVVADNSDVISTTEVTAGAEYTFTMPAQGVTVTVALEDVPPSTPTWNGTSWLPSEPTALDDAIIDGNYTGAGFTCNNLTINSGFTVTLNTDECLEVAGEITDNGNGIILNNGAALVAPNNTTPVNGTYKKTYVLDPNGYGFAATPVGDFPVQSVFSGNYVYWYDESAPTQALAWVNLGYGDMFEDGAGYLFNAPATSKTYSGTFGLGTYTSDIEIPALAFSNPHPTPGHGGFNLIGNPYAAYLDWDGVIKSGLDPNKTVWVWNGTSYTTHIEGDNYGINPATSFFVRAANASASVALENQDTECTASSKDSGFPELRLAASGNGLQDYLRVINPGDFEAYSAKMFTWNEEVPQIYIAGGEESYSIQRMDGIENGETIPVGFVCSQSGTYELSTPLHGLGATVQVYLEDLVTGSFTELTGQNTYPFSYTAGNEPNRFVLHFATTTTDAESITERAVNIYNYAEKVYVNTNGETANKVEIYSLSGQLIHTESADFSTIRSFEVPTTGVYIIKVQTENGITTQRVIVQ